MDPRIIYQEFFAALEDSNEEKLIKLLSDTTSQKILCDLLVSREGFAANIIHTQIKNKKPQNAKILLSFASPQDLNILKYTSSFFEKAAYHSDEVFFIWLYQHLKNQTQKSGQTLSLDNAYMIASRELNLSVFKAIATQSSPTEIRAHTIIKAIENQLDNLIFYQEIMKDKKAIIDSKQVFHIMVFEQNILLRPEIDNWFIKEQKNLLLNDLQQAWHEKNKLLAIKTIPNNLAHAKSTIKI